MFKCHVCGSERSHSGFTEQIFQINGEFRLVENIPVKVCNQCGEGIFSGETTEQIRLMLYQDTKPTKEISVKVYAY
jgi:HTH-type transcriptional regulator / antitoxin MqsA